MNSTLTSEVRVLLRPKWLSVWNRFRFREEGELGRTLILAAVVAAFWLGIYYIFSSFLFQFKIVEEFGEILPGQLLAMIFLFFFGILMWSSLLTSFGVFFLSEDLQLIKSAPVSEEALYLARLIETIIDASWMVLLFGLPIFIAYGVVFEGGWLYYVIVAAVNLAFVVIPAVLGAGLTMLLVNIFPAQRAKDVLMLVSLIFFAGLIFIFRVLKPERLLDPDSFTSMVDFLNAMRAPLSPLLPSQWAAESISTFLIGTLTYDPFWLGMTIISAAAAAVMGMWLARASHDYGFTKTQEARRSRFTRSWFIDRLIGLYAFIFPRQLKQIISKDVKTFIRDITQWSQLFLLAALVVIYVYNFRVLPLARNSYLPTVYLTNLVAFFNLGLSGFVVSAVAARFVFPAVSLEGQAFWLVRSSPLGLKGFLWSKFWISFFPLLILGEVIFLLTSWMLEARPEVAWVGAVSIFLLTLGITGLGIGVGAAYPQFKWENVSKIPASFGGILFMVLSLIFIGAVLVVEWGPMYSIMLTIIRGRDPSTDQLVGAGMSGVLVVVLSLLFFLVPMEAGLRSLEGREIW
ncbi:MAG: hypothetical protein R6W82_10835 [bacterium]